MRLNSGSRRQIVADMNDDGKRTELREEVVRRIDVTRYSADRGLK